MIQHLHLILIQRDDSTIYYSILSSCTLMIPSASELILKPSLYHPFYHFVFVTRVNTAWLLKPGLDSPSQVSQPFIGTGSSLWKRNVRLPRCIAIRYLTSLFSEIPMGNILFRFLIILVLDDLIYHSFFRISRLSW